MDFDVEKSRLSKQIQVLRGEAWEEDILWPMVEAWLENFHGASDSIETEKLHALYLLSRFTYFGQRLIREMLRSAYRDHVRAPLLQIIRKNNPSLAPPELLKLYDEELKSTRFVGLGNPSESGAHLLYYFRQVNSLDKNLFADLYTEFVPRRDPKDKTQLIYKRTHKNVKRLIFFDDLIGSGSQLKIYLKKHLEEIRRTYSDLETRCIVLFAASQGKTTLGEIFGSNASVIFELDNTFSAFHSQSRYFEKCPSWASKSVALKMAHHYGAIIAPSMPLGFKNGQLMLGFSHNTPDNTLPLFWFDGLANGSWSPIFKRFDKQYS